MNDVETAIEHANINTIDLDSVDDSAGGDGDTEVTMVHVAIAMADGMNYTGTISCEGIPTTGALADMVTRAAQGAARTHSPQLADHLEHLPWPR